MFKHHLIDHVSTRYAPVWLTYRKVRIISRCYAVAMFDITTNALQKYQTVAISNAWSSRSVISGQISHCQLGYPKATDIALLKQMFRKNLEKLNLF